MDDVPPYARPVAIGMGAAAAIGLLVNHFAGESLGGGRLLLLCMGPMALLLGIGGAVEPKIVWSLGNYGQHLPLMYKVIGGCLAVAGLLVTLLLIFVVFPVRFG